MKNLKLLIIFIFISAVTVNAQKKVNSKHTNYYKNPKDVLTTEYKLNFTNVVARTVFCKLALKITNNTNDILLFNKGETKFEFGFGSFSPKSKEFYIKPNSSIKKTIDVTGGEKFHVNSFNLNVDGVYLIPINGNINKVEDFAVPASKNSIQTDLFTINMVKSSLKTKEALLVFECTYKGDKIALINSSKLVIKVDDSGREYANDYKKNDIKILKHGDKITFKAIFHIPGRVADMQFANMTILWKDTFLETELKKLEGKTISFEIDPGMTNGKN